MEFVDPNLEAAVRSALDILDGPILAADIDSLSGLSTQDEPVHSLSGLECAINLEMLIVAEGNTASLEPLGSLPKLRHLALKGKIVDISPLADLTALRFLWLGENEIVDIEALTDLTSLTRLYLQSNNITDIGPLAGLTKLTRLSLRNNAIVDIGPLAALENVEELRISNNAIEDVSALEGMTALRQLHAEENLVSDISPIGAMTLLRFTYLQGNQISELDGLLGGAWEQEGGPDCADLHLEDNPLSETAITVTAPEVCEKLEVRITWDVPDGTCGWGFTCAIP